MNIYILDSDDGIIGVYSSMELANEANKRFGACGYVQTETLNEMPYLIDGKYLFSVVLDVNCDCKNSWHSDMSELPSLTDEISQNPRWGHDRDPSKSTLFIRTFAATKKDAIEYAKSKFFPCPPCDIEFPPDTAVRFEITQEILCTDGTADWLERITQFCKEISDESNGKF